MLKNQMWMKYAPDLLTEWQQLMEEGKAVDSFRQICADIVEQSASADMEEAAWSVAKQMMAAPMREDYPYAEPSDLEGIRLSAQGNTPVRWESLLLPEQLRDKIAGAWIGRVSGCLLGKPMECVRTPEIRTILEASRNYPLSRYIDSREFPQWLWEDKAITQLQSWQKCWIDRIGGKAPVDDDTNYTVMALKIIEEYGVEFTPDDVLETWLYSMPMFSACTAERVAYRNAAAGMLAPDTAFYKNPYREWIGAQIRGDFFGYINPGNPGKAAEMAWRDASVSHTKNGIYGEMFVAAMIAKAAVCNDLQEVVEAGLREIPEKSRLAEAIRRVLRWHRQGWDAEKMFASIHETYDEYFQHDWCHTISNAMVVTAALLGGNKEFGKTICLAVQTGFDTDCNAATVGSVLGMILGEKRIPECWPQGFNRTLRTAIDRYHEVTVDQLTDKTMELIRRGW